MQYVTEKQGQSSTPATGRTTQGHLGITQVYVTLDLLLFPWPHSSPSMRLRENKTSFYSTSQAVRRSRYVLLEGQFQILDPTMDVYMKKDDFETQVTNQR